VYGYVDRGDMPELMAHFDVAKPEMTNSKRTTTIVPQQALFLMNSPMSVDVARRITNRPEFTSELTNANAQIVLALYRSFSKKVPDREQVMNGAKILALHRIIFQRKPTPQELKLGLEFVQIESQDDAANHFAAKNISKGGGNRMDARAEIKNEGFRVSRRALTQWETYAQALLFSNEAAYVN
jgi:hypothetical protein